MNLILTTVRYIEFKDYFRLFLQNSKVNLDFKEVMFAAKALLVLI